MNAFWPTPMLLPPTSSPVEFHSNGVGEPVATPMQAVLCSEQDLLDLLREHGPKVKGALLLRYQGSLSVEDVDEVLSIALQRAWQHRESFDASKGSLRTWFFCIAQRVALDRFKLSWHKAKQQEVAWENLPKEPQCTDAEPPEATTELQTTLANAMASLSPVQQHIIWADALGAGANGITSEQLGEELGLPAGTVRVYRKRAMEKLRNLLSAAAPT